MKDKYLFVCADVLPEIFEKVIKAKELINAKKFGDISTVVKTVGISRSAYYKYKDYVFSVSEFSKSNKVTLSLSIVHQKGTLSRVLDRIAKYNGNILTLNQNIPINNTANVTITFDIYNLTVNLKMLIDEIKRLENVVKVDLIAME